MVQDIALYSNPFSGVPTALNDSARNFSRGNYLSGVGNLAMGALSFAPGVGAALGKGIGWLGKGLRGAGKVTNRISQAQRAQQAGKVMRQGGNALIRGGKAYGQAAQSWGSPFARANQALGSRIQKSIPQKYPEFSLRNPLRSTLDVATRNPASFGLSTVSLAAGGGEGVPPTSQPASDYVEPSKPTIPPVPPWAPPQNPYNTY